MSTTEATTSPKPGELPAWAYAAAVMSEKLLGAFFLFGAYLKFMDANAFVPLMHTYVSGTPFDSATLKGLAALVTIGFETGLGVGMLLGLRYRHVVLGLTVAMLVFFTVIVAVVWPEDCGCLPGIPMEPPETIAKNVVMIALAAGAMWIFQRSGKAAGTGGYTRIAATVTIVLGLVSVGYSYPQIFRAKSTDTVAEAPTEGGGEGTAAQTGVESTPLAEQSAGPYAAYTVQSDFGETFDLSSGDYLVASLSMECDHCMASVPALNNLTLNPEFPTLVALGYEPSEGSLDLFVAQTQPMFPIHGIGDNFLEFSEIIGQSPPRLAYVVDGAAVTHWDWKEEMPSEQEILDGIAAAASGAN